MVELTRIKLVYGSDPQGFYWSNSAQKRKEILGVKRNAPATFEAIYQGRPGKRIGSIFLRSDFTYYEPPPDLAQGIRSDAVRNLLKSAHMVLQCWDTAFSSTEQSAHSVCVTAMIRPCSSFHRGEEKRPEVYGECESHFDVDILDVYRDKLDWGGLVNEVKAQYYQWLPQSVLIENRATGISLIQTLPTAGIPVKGVTAGSTGKGARAVNQIDDKSAGSVQGWCRAHRVRFPVQAAWLEDFEKELIDFSGQDDSSSDQVDAFVHLVNEVMVMSVATMLLPTDFGKAPDAKTLGKDMYVTELQTLEDPRLAFLQYLGQVEGMSDDPFSDTCARCTFGCAGDKFTGFCEIQKRRTTKLDSCQFFNDRIESNRWPIN